MRQPFSSSGRSQLGQRPPSGRIVRLSTKIRWPMLLAIRAARAGPGRVLERVRGIVEQRMGTRRRALE
jgi:hypothetical protein